MAPAQAGYCAPYKACGFVAAVAASTLVSERIVAASRVRSLYLSEDDVGSLKAGLLPDTGATMEDEDEEMPDVQNQQSSIIHWDYYGACYYTSEYTRDDVLNSAAWSRKITSEGISDGPCPADATALEARHGIQKRNPLHWDYEGVCYNTFTYTSEQVLASVQWFDKDISISAGACSPQVLIDDLSPYPLSWYPALRRSITHNCSTACEAGGGNDVIDLEPLPGRRVLKSEYFAQGKQCFEVDNLVQAWQRDGRDPVSRANISEDTLRSELGKACVAVA
eukprot:TRINITY_DN10009_c0_g1_i1.p1 TRINITY_DN10009_c0_g1~~TRINITY_DN10009_c0_g1_i1.p1  ORF type:complete len:302 (-),score=44.67 TRINITY_DN10009_c0_g1_i1:194-1030(-)